MAGSQKEFDYLDGEFVAWIFGVQRTEIVEENSISSTYTPLRSSQVPSIPQPALRSQAQEKAGCSGRDDTFCIPHCDAPANLAAT
jgi:hypothetical protein